MRNTYEKASDLRNFQIKTFRTRTQHGCTHIHMTGRRRLLYLTNCWDDSKPYMILVALIKGFHNHIRFAIIRAGSKECTGAGPPEQVDALLMLIRC